MASNVLFERITAAAESNPQKIFFGLVTNRNRIEDVTCAEILERTLHFDAILKNFPATICAIYHRFDSEFVGFVLSALKNNVKILIRRTSLMNAEDCRADLSHLEKNIPVEMIFSDLPLSADFRVLGENLFLRSEKTFAENFPWDFIQLSSGSMNKPAGFCLNFDAILESALHVIDGNRISPESVIVSYLTPAHIYGFVTGFAVPILSGATCLHCPTKIIKDNPQLLLELASDKKVTHISAILKTLERALTLPRRSDYDLSSLFCVSVGGEKINCATYQKVRDVLASFGMNPSGLVNSYGMSELGALTMEDPLKGNTIIEHGGKNFLSVGAADYKNLRIRIFDDARNVLPDSDEGDVGISARNIADFYFQARKLHAVPKTVIAGREFYFNGDNGFSCAGKIFVTGRKANTVTYNALKISGAAFREFVKNELSALGVKIDDCLIFNLSDTDKIICYINHAGLAEEILTALAQRIKNNLHVDIYDFLVEPCDAAGLEKLSLPKVIEMYARIRGNL